MLACSLALRPFSKLLRTAMSELLPKVRRHSKHWSGTTVGGTPYESHDSFTKSPHIAKEPLHRIQRSMSTPSPPATTRNSLEILLPDVVLPVRSAKPPPRPPPPSDAERPDLSIFTKKTVVQQPPTVTRLGSVRYQGPEKTGNKPEYERSLKSRFS